MISADLIAKLKTKYKDIHPLVFQRSLEKAKTGGELFDILSTIPKKTPIIWNDEEKRWVTTKDLVQFELIEKCLSKKNS